MSSQSSSKGSRRRASRPQQCPNAVRGALDGDLSLVLKGEGPGFGVSFLLLGSLQIWTPGFRASRVQSRVYIAYKSLAAAATAMEGRVDIIRCRPARRVQVYVSL